MKIQGKLALVTGASSGIGAVTARVLAEKGADVIVLARREGPLQEVAKKIESLGRKAYVYSVDLSNAEATTQCVAQIKSDLGVPDILVNNAGTGKWKATYNTNPEELLSMTQLPYFATFNMTKGFLKEMLDRDSGHIVNITSAAAMFHLSGASAYSVARWAVRAFTGCLQADLRGTGVNASLIMPSKVGDTNYFEVNKGSEERIPGIANYYRTLTSQEVADAIVKAIEKEKRITIMPFTLRLTYWFQPFAPRLFRWLIESTGWKYEG